MAKKSTSAGIWVKNASITGTICTRVSRVANHSLDDTVGARFIAPTTTSAAMSRWDAINRAPTIPVYFVQLPTIGLFHDYYSRSFNTGYTAIDAGRSAISTPGSAGIARSRTQS